MHRRDSLLRSPRAGQRSRPPIRAPPCATLLANASEAAIALSRLLLAFLSGIPALVYQVIWTRQVGLLVGSQVEAVSLVLVAFFAGLALGGGALGPVADRQRAPA